MPRPKGDNTCYKCSTVFANRQNRWRHMNTVKCDANMSRPGDTNEELQTTIAKLVAKSVKDEATITGLSEKVSNLETVVSKLINMPPIVNIELNVFTDRESAYPDHKKDPEMKRVIKMVFERCNLKYLVEYLFFNEDYPRNRCLKPANDGSIAVYTGKTNEWNGWERQPSELVYTSMFSLFDTMLCRYASVAKVNEDVTNQNMCNFFKKIVVPLEWEWDLYGTGFNVNGYRGKKGYERRRDVVLDNLRAFMQTI
jgi:hypothetical protein